MNPDEIIDRKLFRVKCPSGEIASWQQCRMAGRLEGRQAGSGARAARDGHAADALPSARTGRFGGEPGGGTCARLSSAYTNNAAPSTAIAGRAGRAFLLDRGLRVAALHALDPARIAGQRAGFQISCGVEAGDVVKAQVVRRSGSRGSAGRVGSGRVGAEGERELMASYGSRRRTAGEIREGGGGERAKREREESGGRAL